MFARKSYVLVFLMNLFFWLCIVHYSGAAFDNSDQGISEQSTHVAVKVVNAAISRPDILPQASSISPLAEIMQEDFEGNWPAAGWEVQDYSSGDDGEYFWGKRNCRPHSGSFAGWSVGGGAHGSNLPCNGSYPNNTFSWAIYGPFDLSQATSSILTFHYWGRTDGGSGCPYDYFFVGGSVNGTDFSGTRYCGNWTNGTAGNGYYLDSLDFNNYLGQNQVWLAFVLRSDITIVDIGMTIDDITLDVFTPTPTPTPTSTNTPTSTPTATPTDSMTPEMESFLPAVMVEPNKTPMPPTYTPTPTSTPTDTPTATPTSTPTHTPTPSPLPQLKLYVRPNGMLSQNPETAFYQAFFYPGTVQNWTYTLDGDIPGNTYEFSLMLGSSSTTTFSVSLLADGQTLASTTFKATSNTYERFSMIVTGTDPTTSNGDILTLRVAHASGGNGGLLSGPPTQGIDSYITLPEPQ